MAVTEATLKARFPEFVPATTALVEACIADAELMVDRTFYGDRADMAVTYLAAHLIATNPLGEYSRLRATQDGSTVYSKQYEKIMYMTAAGCRVI